MKLIKTIRDGDVGGGFPDCPVRQERTASRAVIFDGDGKIALLDVVNKRFHKLPGGGVQEGEDIEIALQRELSEEIGCAAKNLRPLAEIEEYRNQWALHQISYCFIADLDGEKGTPHLDQYEADDGFVPTWVNIEDAIKTLEADAPVEDYEGKFIQQRDLAFLKEALEVLGKR